MYSITTNNTILSEFQNFCPPSRTIFYWYDKKNNHYGCKINFDEKGIWDAFQKIFDIKETKQVELVFEIDKYNSEVKISLESEHIIIKIKKALINTYLSEA